MYRVIAPSPPRDSPFPLPIPLLFLLLFLPSSLPPFFFYRSRCPGRSTPRRPFRRAIVYAASLQPAAQLARSWRFSSCVVVPIDSPEPVEAFNFHAAICRAAASTQLSPKSHSAAHCIVPRMCSLIAAIFARLPLRLIQGFGRGIGMSAWRAAVTRG